MELHHINGDHNDNRLENLQLLCPNCHSCTDTYRGKNIDRSAQKETSEVESRKFEETLASNVDGNLELSQKNYILLEESVETRRERPKARIYGYCAYCGAIINRKDQKYCSQECAHNAISKRPDVLTLLDDFKELKSFLQVSKKYGVSDNAVRKWCKLYHILDKVKE